MNFRRIGLVRNEGYCRFAAGVSQVNTAMNQMNQITQQNASASEELAATAEEMTSQTEQLQILMSFFKIAGHTKPAPFMPERKPLKSKKNGESRCALAAMASRAESI